MWMLLSYFWPLWLLVMITIYSVILLYCRDLRNAACGRSSNGQRDPSKKKISTSCPSPKSSETPFSYCTKLPSIAGPSCRPTHRLYSCMPVGLFSVRVWLTLSGCRKIKQHVPQCARFSQSSGMSTNSVQTEVSFNIARTFIVPRRWTRMTSVNPSLSSNATVRLKV